VTTEADLFTTLKTLVSNRVYPLTFVQPSSGALPSWPSIRYTFISVTPAITICGDEGDETADIRVQLDVVDKTFMTMRTLRDNVMAAMRAFDPPAVFENSFEQYDEDTKTYRSMIDYVIYRSSIPGSP
jgi:uncharacterized protein DUF3168